MIILRLAGYTLYANNINKRLVFPFESLWQVNGITPQDCPKPDDWQIIELFIEPFWSKMSGQERKDFKKQNLCPSAMEEMIKTVIRVPELITAANNLETITVKENIRKNKLIRAMKPNKDTKELCYILSVLYSKALGEGKTNDFIQMILDKVTSKVKDTEALEKKILDLMLHDPSWFHNPHAIVKQALDFLS